MQVKSFCGVVASLQLLLALPTAAQEDLVGDRPDVTESAVPITPGRVQLEAGATLEWDDVSELLTAGELLARVGLIRNVELRLGLPSYVATFDEGPDGFDDVSLGAKFVLNAYDAERSHWPQSAIIVETSLPTGSEAFGNDRLQPVALAAFEWPLNDVTGLGVNVGGALVGVEEERLQGLASVALGSDFGERIGGFVELYGFTGETPGENGRVFVDGGVTYAATPDLQFDARAGVELGNDFNQRLVGVGVIWRH